MTRASHTSITAQQVESNRISSSPSPHLNCRAPYSPFNASHQPRLPQPHLTKSVARAWSKYLNLLSDRCKAQGHTKTALRRSPADGTHLVCPATGIPMPNIAVTTHILTFVAAAHGAARRLLLLLAIIEAKLYLRFSSRHLCALLAPHSTSTLDVDTLFGMGDGNS